jgi:hypothetical protein
MDIRHNGLFYRATNKTAGTPQPLTDTTFDLATAAPTSASSKILLCAYKDLMQHFNQLDSHSQKPWQLEINIIARQLSHLFKQAAKGNVTNGYPALSLLKEIRQLDENIIGSKKDLLEPLS